jgi:hypothetical protein
MPFSTKECAWAHVSVTVLSRTIVGLRGFEFKKTVEKEHLYAAGDSPIDIQTGNKKFEGSLKLLKFEVDMLNDAAVLAGYDDILEVPHRLITITCDYKKNANDPKRTITVEGVAFTELSRAMEQNAKMSEISLPLIAMNIKEKLG